MPARFCPSCGASIEDPNANHCPSCGASLAAAGAGAGGVGGGPGTLPGGPGGPPPPPAGSSVPFEDGSQPFMPRYLETLKMAFANPVQLFSNMNGHDIGPPLVYGVINGTIGAIFAILWQMLFGGLAFLAEGAGEEFAVSTGLLILFMFLSPILALVGIFISAGLFHVSLLILGDGQRGFGMTLSAICYGGTPNLLSVVPFCGGIIGGIWALVLTIMAAYYGHRTDVWRAILGYFLPMIVCCCLVFFLAMSFGWIGALSN